MSPGSSDGEVADLAAGVREGDRRSLARAITLVESTRAEHRRDALALIEELLPRSGGSIRLGISGPPGVGKSTFIEALGLHLTAAGLRLAVLAVDPSSTRSGGSVLGDKTRMVELARHPAAFIRPSPGGREVGGVARRTREALLVCEAAGHDVVIVETIGVGQSEVAVADMVDCFTLLVAPGGGDELQGIKRGVMELADLLVVTKADGDLLAAAGRAVADHRHALELIRPRYEAWRPEVLSCSAVDQTGVADVWAAVTRFTEALRASGELSALRREQAVSWLWSDVRHGLLARLQADAGLRRRLDGLEASVRAGTRSPSSAADELLTSLGASEGITGDTVIDDPARTTRGPGADE